MYYINRPSAIANQNVDCVSVPSKQLCIPPYNTQSVPATNNKPQNNVISLASVRKPALQEETANFKYPMLECS